MYTAKFQVSECTKCHAVRTLDNFWRDNSRPDGIYAWCLTCVNEYQRSKRKTKAYKWNNFCNNAKKRGIDIEITRDQYFQIMDLYDSCTNPRCNKMNYSWFSRESGFKNTLTLDRIDSNGGYSLDNIQVLCHSCNASKYWGVERGNFANLSEYFEHKQEA